MSNIIDLIPENHFGEPYNKIVKETLSGESVGVYGMYGVGVQYTLKFLEKQLREVYHFDNVFHFKGGIIKDDPVKAVKEIITQRFSLPISHFDSLISTVDDRNKWFLIFDDLENINKKEIFLLLDFLDSLRKVSPENIVNVIALDSPLLTSDFREFKLHSTTISSLIRLDLFNEEGTRKVIEINNKFYKWDIPEDLSAQIHYLTGGNARLIKYLCKTLSEYGVELVNDPEKLIHLQPLSLKLETFAQICFSLNLEDLKLLGIINNKAKVFSPLVEGYINEYTLPNIESLNLNLSEKEKKILSILYMNRGRLVLRDTLDYMMGLDSDNYSLWTSYKVINRIKKKVFDYFDIKSVRDKGYYLEVKSKRDGGA